MLSCGNNFLTCGNDLLSCGNNLLTCGNDFLTCGNELSTCGNELLTCGNELLTRGHNFLSRGNEIKNAKKTVLCPFLASVKNNYNFEKIKVICNLETVYVCTLYYLKRTIQSQKWCRVFSMGSTNCMTFFCMGFLCRAFLYFT